MPESFATDLPDLPQLRAFARVAETLNFTAAARTLELDPSVVARKIALLEQRLGVRLFERTTRRMTLTEAGDTYLRRIQPALDALIAADVDTRERHDRPTGLLRVAVPAIFGRLRIGPVLPRFMTKYPDVALDVRFADRYVDLVAERFDVAIRLGQLADSNLVARRIGGQTRGLYAAPRYLARNGEPRRPEDLATHRGLGFVGYDRPSQWAFSRGRRRVVVDVPLPLLSDDAALLVAATVSGHGIMASTDWLLQREVADGRVVRVLPEWTVGAPGAIWLVLPSTRFVPAKTRVFADWIVDVLRAEPTGLR